MRLSSGFLSITVVDKDLLPRRETSVQSSRLSGSDEVEIRIMGRGHLRLGVVNYQLTKVGFIM
jgi:hypothetical protein